MNQTAIAQTSAASSRDAAHDLGHQIASQLDGERPDAVILFASSKYDHAPLLEALGAACRPHHLVGASSAGEFTRQMHGEGFACALAVRSTELEFTTGVGRDLQSDRAAAARSLVGSFRGLGTHPYPYRSALVMTDALAGHADELIEQLTLASSGRYQFFGGGAGDDGQFRRTHVFHGGEVLTDAAISLEVLSKKPLGIGVGHGWQPQSSGMRVTEAAGMELIGINGYPAVDALADHARATGQELDPANPMRFFLHNVIGIDTPHGHRLRVPLAIRRSGSIACAAEVPAGAKIFFMGATASSTLDAAARATRSALDKLEGHLPLAAVFFDCVATRLRMPDAFELELDQIGTLLGPDAGYVGCNTHGQIARAAGQFGGFHNCTAVVCVFPA